MCVCVCVTHNHQELLDSGYLTEVHKFSKFIHGSCTLFPEMVQVRRVSVLRGRGGGGG
jgi:SPX domain protein involved in polyphosphate accumulation